jgi:O-antigen/teichoic acid export membrane protein
MYEEKVDVRPLISKLSGYYLLLALPLVVFVSVYSSDIITLFANSKFQEAYILLPFFAFSSLFLSFADYTTLQYHLAQKTQILTWMKLISGILCFVLNLYLIKEFGLIGVGIATLLSNIFYFIATLCVKLPSLEYRLPIREVFVVLISFVPTILFSFLLHVLNIDIILEMSLVFSSYYIFYYGISKLFSVKY